MGKFEIARAKLFMHDGSQAVSLPEAFHLEGSEVVIRRDGDKVILEPLPSRPKNKEEWQAFWARLDTITDEPFPEREQPASERGAIDLD